MMTLEQFQATRRESANLGTEPRIWDDSLDGIPGWVYLDCLFIERLPDGLNLRIANCQSGGSLDVLEAELYEWAKDEGYCD